MVCSRIVREGRVPHPGELKTGALLLPLGNKELPPGFIYLETTRSLSKDDQHLIQVMVNQCSSALDNLRLHFQLKEANRESLYMLALAAEFKDRETGGHIHRISEYTRLLALELGMREEDAEKCAQASILHDIGKLGIPDAILQKKERLTEEEFLLIQNHTTLGARILEQHHCFLLARDIALYHHEHWDGGGYPQGLKGDEIPLAARIVSVADVYDALSHKRPYKEAWAPEHSLANLRENAGTQFDPAVVDAFLALIDRGVFPINVHPSPPGWDNK
ncbi:MAG: HD domain-containing protein [Candidatus Electrothrix sp. ATG1]|nr:HD domain-containing protein [Candidatus Electrothrix sp. ATG1]